MKKLWNRRGEMLVESLITMVIIAMTGLMLAMAVASALRANAEAAQTVTFVNNENAAEQGTFTASLGDIDMGSVTVKEEGGLYFYETG